MSDHRGTMHLHRRIEMHLHRRIERYTHALVVSDAGRDGHHADDHGSQELAFRESIVALQDSIVELRDSVCAFKEPAHDIPEWPDTEALERQPPDELVSPELVLVAPPGLAAAARRQLPEPEPLDAWVARMRYAERERDWRAFEQTDQECGERETLSSGFGAIAFAVVTTILSALPVLAFVLA